MSRRWCSRVLAGGLIVGLLVIGLVSSLGGSVLTGRASAMAAALPPDQVVLLEAVLRRAISAEEVSEAALGSLDNPDARSSITASIGDLATALNLARRAAAHDPGASALVALIARAAKFDTYAETTLASLGSAPDVDPEDDLEDALDAKDNALWKLDTLSGGAVIPQARGSFVRICQACTPPDYLIAYVQVSTRSQSFEIVLPHAYTTGNVALFEGARPNQDGFSDLQGGTQVGACSVTSFYQESDREHFAALECSSENELPPGSEVECLLETINYKAYPAGSFQALPNNADARLYLLSPNKAGPFPMLGP